MRAWPTRLGLMWAVAATTVGACDSGGGAHDAGPVACTTDRQCSGAGLVCDLVRGACVECVSAIDCASSQACRAGSCLTVVPCTSSRMCPGQVCDPMLHYCVDCVTD